MIFISSNLISNNTFKTLRILKALVFFFLLCTCFNATAQSTKQKELERKRTALQQEIKQINTLLFNTKKEEKNLLSEIDNINQRIKIRIKLINTIRQESSYLGSKIATNTKKIKALEKELALLKEDYAAMIYKSYKNKSTQSRTMFILSSENFHQAYKRLMYMKQYREFRKKQGLDIEEKTKKIKTLNDDLKVQKIQKENLLAEQREEQTIIEAEKKEQERLIAVVKSQEKKYISEIEQKQKEEQKLDKQIEKLIREAIAAANKANKAGKSAKFILTPQAKALASKFEQNKRKLPWPVVNALVIRNFGKIPHKTLRGITIQSNGIHIATSQGSNAKAIFEGSVLAIQVASNGVKTVMVQHGNYISLYSNLETVHVRKGDKISLKQSLGKIYTDKVTGKTVLKFQIWKDTAKENPRSWLLPL